MERNAGLRRSPMKRGSRRTGPTNSIRAIVWVRSGGWCEIGLPGCTRVATDIHHRLGRKAGGRKGDAAERINQPSNLIHACRSCHRVVTSPVGEWRQEALDRGLIVLEHEVPAEVPCGLRTGPVYLLDDGTTEAVA